MTQNIPEPNGANETSGVIRNALQNLDKALTGIVASDKKDLFLSLGYIFQRTRNGEFLKGFGDEWDKYVKKGRINADYIKSSQHRECLQELLDFLDNDSADAVRFNAIKQILLNAATEQRSNRDDILPQQLMRLARRLTSGDVLLLSSVYEISKTHFDMETIGGSATGWIKHVASNSPLRFPALVELHEESLMKHNLISGREHSDRSGIDRHSKHFRLTGLGLELCKFMTEWEET
jgi:hypothetical protein